MRAVMVARQMGHVASCGPQSLHTVCPQLSAMFGGLERHTEHSGDAEAGSPADGGGPVGTGAIPGGGA